MRYTREEVLEYVAEEDVKFIRLAFCDVYGRQKNISIMPSELESAFEYGVAIDGSAISGFDVHVRSDLFLQPDPDTLTVLPWRPEHGRVVRMFCSVSYPDRRPFENDARALLKKAVADAAEKGVSFAFGPELEFYLFRTDDSGEPTSVPYDRAGYMDIAPDDRGENVRREVCLTLEQMGIIPEASHHEEGPGQNEIDIRYTDALTAADNTMTLRTVVKTIAARSGLYADFSPKPMDGRPGNGFHMNISVSDPEKLPNVMAGVMARIREMTLFLNPSEASYQRLGKGKAPAYISWSHSNRSQLIRIPATRTGRARLELRSPDPETNPYIAFALIIYAGLSGIEDCMTPPPEADMNLYAADEETLRGYEKLPESRGEAVRCAKKSEFIQRYIPKTLLSAYCK